MFDDGWEGLSDQFCAILYSVILYVFIQIALGGGWKADSVAKKLPMGMGCKRKEDGLGLLESGMYATQVWGVRGN